jgi:hypothetical protein
MKPSRDIETCQITSPMSVDLQVGVGDQRGTVGTDADKL